MYTSCKQCGNIIESPEEHDCPSKPPALSFESIGYGMVTVRMDLKEARWCQSEDGFAHLILVTKNGSKIIYKVDRRTAISVCRKLMGGPR